MVYINDADISWSQSDADHAEAEHDSTMHEYTAYGPNAPFGNSIGYFESEEAAQAYVDGGTEGDFGDNAYVVCDTLYEERQALYRAYHTGE